MKLKRNEKLFVQILENLIPSLKIPISEKNIIVEKIKIVVENLPSSFDKFTICHISDIHNANIFDKNPQLLDQLKKEKIDITVISGDLAHDNNFENSLAVINQINLFCPHQNIYISAGNHDLVDYKNKKYQEIEKLQNLFTANGAVFLRNEFRTITKNSDKIHIIGIDDPELEKNENEFIDKELKRITQNLPKNQSKFLISHRPEKIEIYNKYQIDLAFTGHAHGGQIILPRKKGVIAPNQGIFPKYFSGLYQHHQTQMIVSPGVSNSYIIPRINNPGKIFLIELQKEI